MNWIILLAVLFLFGTLTHIKKRLDEILQRFHDIENAISDFENEFHDRFPRNNDLEP